MFCISSSLLLVVEPHRPVLARVVQEVGIQIFLGVQDKLAVQLGLPQRVAVAVVQQQLGLTHGSLQVSNSVPNACTSAPSEMTAAPILPTA